MAALLNVENVFWAATTTGELVLLVCLVRRKFQANYPLFTGYIAITILQSAFGYLVYSHWDFSSPFTRDAIWSSQGIVLCARFAAAFEMARRILASYKGIWMLALRILGIVTVLVLGYSMLFSEKRWSMFILNADRSVELTIAAFIVTLLLFARYYRLPISHVDRALSIGFCLYSCFYVINDSLLEKWLGTYTKLWSFLNIITFLASIMIWIQAVLARAPEEAKQVTSVPSQGLYEKLSPELNMRLRLLNEQLMQLLRSENERS